MSANTMRPFISIRNVWCSVNSYSTYIIVKLHHLFDFFLFLLLALINCFRVHIYLLSNYYYGCKGHSENDFFANEIKKLNFKHFKHAMKNKNPLLHCFVFYARREITSNVLLNYYFTNFMSIKNCYKSAVLEVSIDWIIIWENLSNLMCRL